MLCKSARLVLRAYKEEDISARLDLLMKAFWDDTEDSEDILRLVECARADLRTIKVTPIIPIIHCNRLCDALTDFFVKKAGDEMPYDWFVSTVLRATNWLEGADCDAYATLYLNREFEEVRDAISAKTKAPAEEPLDTDFGFSVMLPVASEPKSVPLFHYVLGAIYIIRALCTKPA